MNNRLKRIEDFKKFYNDSKNFFNDIAENDHSHKHLDDLFSLCICPGGRMGGVNEKTIEVFYGARPIGKNTTIGPNFQKNTKLETEDGAMLRYYLTDAGNVVCSLFPAKSENRRPHEDFIIIEFLKSPSKLWKRAKSHWKFFISYMEVTCLDGSPDFFQRLRVFYIRSFKRYIIDNIAQTRKFAVLIKEVSKYVLTIGLSGFLILIITLVKDNVEPTQNIDQFKELQQSIEKISETTTRISISIEENQQMLQEFIDLKKLDYSSIENASKSLVEYRKILDRTYDELIKIENKFNSISSKYLKSSDD